MWNANGDDFWIPSYKWQLVDWLSEHYPCGINGDIIHWKKYSQKQLLAIYIDKRRKYEQRKKAEETNKNKKDVGTTKIGEIQRQLEFQF